MRAIDFSYDGISLSSKGWIVCQFNEGGGFETSSAGSNIYFNKVSVDGGRKWFLTSSLYDSCFETSFSFCKPNGAEFTQAEYIYVMRWLNRPGFHELTITDTLRTSIKYNGSFNVDMVTFRGKLVGFTANFVSDAPYGKSSPLTVSNVSASSTITIHNASDIEESIIPDTVEITTSTSGNLLIGYSHFSENTSIKNCSASEKITIDGVTGTISTTASSHAILQDFNFVYPRIGNQFNVTDGNKNIWTFSIPCLVKIIYTPLKKVVF